MPADVSAAGITISFNIKNHCMENGLLQQIDSLVDKYKKEHKGEKPLYIIVSSDENKQLIELIRKANNYSNEQIITEYKGMKLAQHPQQVNGKIYVSNELPETGS
jgi:hypothetical protein